MTYLTVPISAVNLKEAATQVVEAKRAGAEALELRTDYLAGLEVELVKKLIDQAKKTKLPVIVTCRDKREGGANDYPLKMRLEVLTTAIESGAEFIDFEYANFNIAENQKKITAALAKNKKTRLILSAHNFKSRFEDIKKLYSDICGQYREAVPKLVYTANHINDCFEAFDLLHSKKGDLIAFCMGEAGLISRIIIKKLGALVSYAALSEKDATAAGQLTVEQIRKQYRWERIDSDTELYGIIGWPVAHSLSPSIHNGCFEKIGANKVYLPLLVDGGGEQFNQFLENILSRDWLDFKGFSVTIPHKENALRFVRQKDGFIEPLAERIGAVNTIIIKTQDSRLKTQDQRLISAYNTDYAGAMDAITAGMGIGREDLKGVNAAVIGAGGAARAIVAGLRDCGVKVKIYNRTIKRAETLAEEFDCEFAGLEELPKLNAKLLINCTNVGMKKIENRIQNTEHRIKKTSYETPVPKEYLKKGMTVFDTVYNPAETLLLKQAQEAGAKTISGLDMFVNQAVGQFKLFTNKPIDLEIIRQTILSFLNNKSENAE